MWKKYLKKYWKAAVAAVFLAVAGICYGGNGSGFSEIGVTKDSFGRNEGPAEDAGLTVTPEPGERLPDAVPETEPGSIGEAGSEPLSEPIWEAVSETPSEPGCFVHICGEVNAPGVYELSEGSRVFEAVDAAGGFTDEAAGELLNLAEKITDGMKIVVLSRDEADGLTEEERRRLSGAVKGGTDSSSGSGQGSGLVNINTASKEALMTLSGIGESKAEDIIRYREEAGRFEKIEDIMKVPGIKNAGFQKIKDSITV